MKNLIFITLCFFSSIVLAQEHKRDTLFIKYDNSLLTRGKLTGENTFVYTIKGTNNSDDFVYLLEQEIYYNLRPNKVLCFKKVLKNSNAYYKKEKLNNSILVKYLGKYDILLIKGKKYIKVAIVHEIE